MSRRAANYTFEDFLKRLERSPQHHIPPLYHEHRELFVHRPDMLTRAVSSLTWERGCALLSAAYYSQPINADAYRGLLARMLLHNQHTRAQQTPAAMADRSSGDSGDLSSSGAKSSSFASRKGQGSAYVPWRVALKTYSEAVLAHGTTLPTRTTVSALRLLAPHRQWQHAIQVLKLSEANDLATKPMLLDAAHACATPAAWMTAMRLLDIAHRNDPELLPSAIQSLRPEGDDALLANAAANAVLPRPSRDPQLTHALSVLGDVVSVTPWKTALKNELCVSFLTHLAASTTETAEAKALALVNATKQLPVSEAMRLLVDYTEPHLAPSQSFTSDVHSVTGSSLDGNDESQLAFSRHLLTLADSPSTVAPLIAALINKMPTAEHAAAFVRKQTAVLSLPLLDAADEVAKLRLGAEDAVNFGGAIEGEIVDKAADSSARSHDAMLALQSMDSDVSTEFVAAQSRRNALAALRHPIVVQSILTRCCQEAGGWKHAAQYFTHVQAPLPTFVASTLFNQLREARQSELAVVFLQQCVTTGTKITHDGLVAVLQCVLAHNRRVHHRQSSSSTHIPTSTLYDADAHRGMMREGEENGVKRAASLAPAVHWLSALSWATNMMALPHEQRIYETGSESSRGAISHRSPKFAPAKVPLSPQLLSLLIHVCVDGGSASGALRAMGYARSVDKTELLFNEQLSAILFCAMYGRWNEGEAITVHAEKQHGEAAVKPLRQLWEAAKEAIPSP